MRKRAWRCARPVALGVLFSLSFAATAFADYNGPSEWSADGALATVLGPSLTQSTLHGAWPVAPLSPDGDSQRLGLKLLGRSGMTDAAAANGYMHNMESRRDELAQAIKANNQEIDAVQARLSLYRVAESQAKLDTLKDAIKQDHDEAAKQVDDQLLDLVPSLVGTSGSSSALSKKNQKLLKDAERLKAIASVANSLGGDAPYPRRRNELEGEGSDAAATVVVEATKTLAPAIGMPVEAADLTIKSLYLGLSIRHEQQLAGALQAIQDPYHGMSFEQLNDRLKADYRNQLQNRLDALQMRNQAYTEQLQTLDRDARMLHQLKLLPVFSESSIAANPAVAGRDYQGSDFSTYVSGGKPPYAFTANNLPAGLAIDQTGRLRGTPNGSTEDKQFSICATDALGSKTCTQGQIKIVQPMSFNPPQQLPQAIVGRQVNINFSQWVSGGLSPLVFRAAEAPSGFYLTPSGFLTGYPGSRGVNRFNVCVTDRVRQEICREVWMSVAVTVDMASIISWMTSHMPGHQVPSLSCNLTGQVIAPARGSCWGTDTASNRISISLDIHEDGSSDWSWTVQRAEPTPPPQSSGSGCGYERAYQEYLQELADYRAGRSPFIPVPPVPCARPVGG